ncbi:hypothetical protein [Legionella sp. km772]|uniref:hypothetical protein n=1 Tax=Legionella sp. km772 TaxID=2498111 RepID=UPI000F8CBAA4|nr:hypothetical protein [Legionella sp. km772]RUR05774.1 hypothetical protein ELY15_13910 [Legionella sp. km772]
MVILFPSYIRRIALKNTFFSSKNPRLYHTADKKTAFVLDVGIGPNIINTKNYNEESIDNGITIPNQAYHGKMQTVFSAAVGAGVRFNNVWRTTSFEVAYKYFYLNKANLAPRDGVLNGLSTGNINANALVLTLVA